LRSVCPEYVLSPHRPGTNLELFVGKKGEPPFRTAQARHVDRRSGRIKRIQYSIGDELCQA
jgi:hypothetical protein